MKTVAQLINDLDRKARIQGVSIIRQRGLRNRTSDLVRLSFDPVASVRFAAAHALGFFGAERSASRLRDLVADREEAIAVRGAAAEALGNLRDHDAIPVLMRGLHDRSPSVRFWCAYSLGELHAVSAVSALRRAASAERAWLRTWGSVRQEMLRVAELVERRRPVPK
jgi:HEAT repeat protein